MAGRPKLKEDRKQLAYMLPADAARIWDDIEAGRNLYRIADSFGISYTALKEWINHPDRIEHYKRARVDASHRFVLDALTIADAGLPINPACGPNGCGPNGEPVSAPDAARDKLRIGQRNWLASRWNPEQYGEQRQPAVQINLATLHIDALRTASSPRPILEAERRQSHIQDVVVQPNKSDGSHS